MKTYNKLILGLIAASSLAVVGCKDRMIEMNTNPDTMQNADVAPLFVGATENFGYRQRNTLEVKYDGVMSLMQYISRYTSDGNPYVDPTSPGRKAPGSWNDTYTQFYDGYKGQYLYNLVKYIDAQPDKAKYADVVAICEVLSVYQQWQIASNFGALVYQEAFKGISDGITQPKYQKIQEIWQDLDNRLKAAVDTLAKPARSDLFSLGKSDFFNGWINTPTPGGGSSVAEQSDYGKQRGNWLKFANMFRLEMAWMLDKVQPANFAKVTAEVIAVPNGLMTDISEGTYYNYSHQYDSNPDDVNAISKDFGVGESFINTMIRLGDPRLPLMARPNGLSSELSPNFKFLQTYFADSLAKYGDLMNGKNIYVGKNTNPRWYGEEIFNGNQFPTYISKTFSNLPNLNYPNSMSIEFGGKIIEMCPAGQDKFNLAVQVISSAQGRYYVRTGGKGNANGPTVIGDNVNMYRYDGTSDPTNSKWLLRRPIYTYAQQCFLLAISGTSAGGFSPAQWYAKGIEAAMIEAQDNAVRYGIQVAVDPTYPKIQGTLLANIPYTYDASAEASAMLSKAPYSAENAMMQAWLYLYNQPEVAYMWWLKTGLLPVKAHADVAAAKADQSPYLEKPYSNSSDQIMDFPRRACLPNKAPVNVNFMPIQSALEAEPGFGQWENTTGRIWWDVQ